MISTTMSICFFILLLLINSPLLVTGQSSCPLPTVAEIESGLNELLLDADSGGGPYDSTVSSYQYTCLAQGSTKDTYRRVSIIATFTPNSGQSSQTQHFQLECLSGTWRARISDGFGIPPSNPMLRRDCLTCVPENLLGDSNHCSECSATCRNMGQGSCVSSINDCCPFFGLDNMCTTSCPTNYIANVDTNFTCVCNYTCGPGEVVNATCNGCNLTDICLRDMPCQNGGSCILLSAPDNYTCNCSGTGFTGENCSININDCSPNPCQNNGTCVDEIAGYNCNCSNGYTGENCSIIPTPCSNECRDCDNGCCKNCSNGYTLNGCNCELVTSPPCNVPNCLLCKRSPPNCCDKCSDGYRPPTTATCSCEGVVPVSIIPTPSQSPDQGGRGGDGIGTGGLVGIIIGILLGILLLLALAAIIAYVVYYFVAGAGAAGHKANANLSFSNVDDHDNPLDAHSDESSKL